MALQVRRTATVATTKPVGELVLLSMRGYEKLGWTYEYQVELLSEDPNLGMSELLGHPISIMLELPDSSLPPREFNGIVSQFWFSGTIGRHACYQATIRPTLWLLSQRIGSRVHEGTVPDVVEALLREHGVEFSKVLDGPHRKFEYLVQYRESDLHFVSRIMELEGIYFYFKHAGNKDTVVLANTPRAHSQAKGYESIPYYLPQSSERRERDHLDLWQSRRAIRAGVFTARDFNFTSPAKPIHASLPVPLDFDRNRYEVYEYPGQFQQRGDGETLVRTHLEELQADYDVAYAEGNARGLTCGALFGLTRFAREDQNKEYLITQAHYDMRVADYESVHEADQVPDFRVKLIAMDSTRPYRPPRVTQKPVVQGPQTATVAGKEGEEIWTDKYGRVLLQFHWDRRDLRNQKSSCWVRVSQAWAGMNWGSIHIPRIGQEVIVDFLEGDPDRPLVTGRVYNENHMPPYELPLNQTQSGIKSRSTKGGTPNNFNEIRFEDKKGKEDLFIHAERSQTTVVKGSQSISVGGDRSVSVTGDDTEDYKKERTLTVKAMDTEEYKNARKVTVVNRYDMEVRGSGYHLQHSVCKLDVESNYAALTNTDCTVSLDGGKGTFKATGPITIDSGGSSFVVVENSKVGITASSFINLFAPKIEICGDDIVLKGKNITVTGETTVKLSGGGSTVELKSGNATVAGGGSKVELTSGGAAVTGTTVKLNS